MNNTQKYVIIFAKDEQGQEVKYRFILSLGKRLSKIKDNLANALDVDGVDTINPHGFYTLEITIGRAFDAEEVLAELIPRLENALSDIVLATPSRISY